MRHWGAPLQVPCDAAWLQAVPQPRAGDVASVGRPVPRAKRAVQPLLQIRFQLEGWYMV